MEGRLDWRSSGRRTEAGVRPYDASLLTPANPVIRTSLYTKFEARPIHRHLPRRDHYSRGSESSWRDTHIGARDLLDGS